MNRDNIDFGKERISSLFRRILIPTLLGMLCMSVMTIIDGAFVGHGAGSDALAAINIFCPLWLIVTGFGLMYGIGCSVVASIHLSHENTKAANINITQTLLFGTVVSLLLSLVVNIFDEEVARLLGASDQLLPLVLDYQKWLSLAFVPIFLETAGLLIIRMDGSPKYAMWCSSLPSVINVVLDYVFLYVLDWGLEGVAIATAIGCLTGGVMVVAYMLWMTKRIALYRLKRSMKSLRLMIRNIGYQTKLGVAALFGDISIAIFLLVGNHVFMHYLSEDGVAAFSIVCYVMPFIFMTGNAIAQSGQPIISYNYGADKLHRVNQARLLIIRTALAVGVVTLLIGMLCSEYIANIFLESEYASYQMAVAGLPIVALGFIPYIYNVTMIGYLQSIERAKSATLFSALRSVIFIVPAFILMPKLVEGIGIWLALPISESLTMILLYSFIEGKTRQ
ncbi:MAG: MATE family efflux transporter [Alistipes sp.]|nr:MATE family efflux transporter [Alistipes sp.]